MGKRKAAELWAAIVSYGDAREEWGAEGNSGEFHSKVIALHLDKELKLASEHLVTVFAAHTGWKPVQCSASEWEMERS